MNRRQFVKGVLATVVVCSIPVSAPQVYTPQPIDVEIFTQISAGKYLDNMAEMMGIARQPATLATMHMETDEELRERCLASIRTINKSVDIF